MRTPKPTPTASKRSCIHSTPEKLAKMNTPKARSAAASLFLASPEALGAAAVNAQKAASRA